jgi:hypothetical protein
MFRIFVRFPAPPLSGTTSNDGASRGAPFVVGGHRDGREAETPSPSRSSSEHDRARFVARRLVFVTLVALPIAYVAWLVALALKRRGTEVLLSLLTFAITIVAGAWSIRQSRSSTAAIGFIFLPMLGCAAGGLVLGFMESRRTRSATLRALGIVALVGAAFPAVVAVRGGRTSIAKNQSRDADQIRRDSAYARDRARLDTTLAASGDHAADTLEALVRAHGDDRELILAVLERPEVPAAVLDSFARSPDLGLALQAVRNPSAPPATLERIYRTHPYRDYFLQALAAHPNSPPAILREIRALRPAPIIGLDIWFAGNRSTPADVLRDVARTTESIDAVRTLLRHPALDCGIVEGAANGPAVRAHHADADVAQRIIEARASHCH